LRKLNRLVFSSMQKKIRTRSSSGSSKVKYVSCLFRSVSETTQPCQEFPPRRWVLGTSLHSVASPRFIGRRSASTVLSQDCLGRPILRLQLTGDVGPIRRPGELGGDPAWGRHSEDVQRRTEADCGQNGCPLQSRISSLVTNSDQCMFRSGCTQGTNCQRVDYP